MNRELNSVIKTVFDFIDQISENISDLRDRQEKIKIILLSMLGTIIGSCIYNSYLTTRKEFSEINTLKINDNIDEEKPPEKIFVKPSIKLPTKPQKNVNNR
jgi:hypothetical protein